MGGGMTITQGGQLLGTILAAYTGIPQNRIILKNEKYDAPKDGAPYILIDYDGMAGMVGIVSKKDFTANTETMSISAHERFSIDFCGFGQEVTDRKNEVSMALKSSAAIRAAEDANCSIYVAGPTLDLSSIEGSSALRRYRIPVILSTIDKKTMAENLIDKFTTPTIETEA
jgi:hypothetical protein